jgi:hypothetical protein
VSPSLEDFFKDSMTLTLAGPAVAVKRKRDKKRKSDPVSSLAPRLPREVKPFTKRLKEKKTSYRDYYQGVKPGGYYRHMIESPTNGLSQAHI